MKRRILALYGPPGRYRVARISTLRGGYIVIDTRTRRQVGPEYRYLPTALRAAISLSA